jgi:hypothetical protein
MSYLQERSASNVMGERERGPQRPRGRAGAGLCYAPLSCLHSRDQLVGLRLRALPRTRAAPRPPAPPRARPAASLKAMMPAQCTVLRDGAATKVDAHDLVPGDLVAIRLGDR